MVLLEIFAGKTLPADRNGAIEIERSPVNQPLSGYTNSLIFNG
jgi:hypothetical protein